MTFAVTRLLAALLTAVLSCPYAAADPVRRPDDRGIYLAWTTGGLPPGFREAVRGLPNVRQSLVVAAGTAWLTRAVSARGRAEAPPQGLAYPIEVAAVDPSEVVRFLPRPARRVAALLGRGEGVLGSSAARVRKMGAGSTLSFGTTAVRVAAVLPDRLIGAKELLVSRHVGWRMGITRDRYALLRLTTPLSDRALALLLRRIVPAAQALRVRAPGETRFLREADAAIPPVRLKLAFGEFAARPEGGYLFLDPSWVRANIARERVPILGTVLCNVELFQQLRGALGDVVRRGLAGLIKPSEYGGCYSPRFAMRDPRAGISHHSWGAAIDINVTENPYGARPSMDPRIVRIFKHWGFRWGGDWLIPDGMHFEYGRPAPVTRPPNRPWPRA